MEKSVRAVFEKLDTLLRVGEEAVNEACERLERVLLSEDIAEPGVKAQLQDILDLLGDARHPCDMAQREIRHKLTVAQTIKSDPLKKIGYPDYRLETGL